MVGASLRLVIVGLVGVVFGSISFGIAVLVRLAIAFKNGFREDSCSTYRQDGIRKIF